MPELLIDTCIVVVGIIVVLTAIKFLFGSSEANLSESLSMQKEGLDGQEKAIKLCEETLEYNKELLSEIRSIKEMLEKRMSS